MEYIKTMYVLKLLNDREKDRERERIDILFFIVF